MLAARSKDPDDSDELRKALLKLEMAYVEIASLKLEIVHLKEELDECAQGHMGFVVVGVRSLRQCRSQSTFLMATQTFDRIDTHRHRLTHTWTRRHRNTDTQTHRY